MHSINTEKGETGARYVSWIFIRGRVSSFSAKRRRPLFVLLRSAYLTFRHGRALTLHFIYTLCRRTFGAFSSPAERSSSLIDVCDHVSLRTHGGFETEGKLRLDEKGAIRFPRFAGNISSNERFDAQWCR